MPQGICFHRDEKFESLDTRMQNVEDVSHKIEAPIEVLDNIGQRSIVIYAESRSQLIVERSTFEAHPRCSFPTNS